VRFYLLGGILATFARCRYGRRQAGDDSMTSLEQCALKEFARAVPLK